MNQLYSEICKQFPSLHRLQWYLSYCNTSFVIVCNDILLLGLPDFLDGVGGSTIYEQTSSPYNSRLERMFLCMTCVEFVAMVVISKMFFCNYPSEICCLFLHLLYRRIRHRSLGLQLCCWKYSIHTIVNGE